MHGWHGPQCEFVFISELVYGYSRQTARVETAALSTLIFLAFIATCIAALALYIYRRFSLNFSVFFRVAKTYDARSTLEDRNFPSWDSPKSTPMSNDSERPPIPFASDRRLVKTRRHNGPHISHVCEGGQHRPPPIIHLAQAEEVSIA